MSGISRLANAAGNLAKQADAAADAAAADLEAAFGKQMDVAQKYKTFAADVKQKAADAENQLNQISNLPTLDGSTS